MEMLVKVKRNRLNRHESYDSTNIEVLKGNFTILTNRLSSEIRIFISSTLKDFEVERNYLVEHVFDELRRNCLEKYQKDLLVSILEFKIVKKSVLNLVI
jgi:hypothetical protein